MPDVRYVCVSDLHFGATSSILTHLEHVDEVDLVHASPVLVALLDALDDLAAANESGELPTLVLLGDVLELARTSSHVAAMVFDQFVNHALARESRILGYGHLDTVFGKNAVHDTYPLMLDHLVRVGV